MYNVHVKRVTASDARRNWFRILDEVAGGEVVVVERHGTRILLQRQPGRASASKAPDYSDVLRVRDAASADKWTWTWSAAKGVRPAKRRTR